MLNHLLEDQRDIFNHGPSKGSWKELQNLYWSSGYNGLLSKEQLEIALDDANTKLDNFGWPDHIRQMTFHEMQKALQSRRIDPVSQIARAVRFDGRFIDRDYKLDVFAHCRDIAIAKPGSPVTHAIAWAFFQEAMRTTGMSINSLELHLQALGQTHTFNSIIDGTNILASLSRFHIDPLCGIDSVASPFLGQVANRDDLSKVTDARIGFWMNESFQVMMGDLLISPLFEGLQRLELQGGNIETHPDHRALLFGSSVISGLSHLGIPITSPDTLLAIGSNCADLDSLHIFNNVFSSFHGDHTYGTSVPDLRYSRRLPDKQLRDNPNTVRENKLLQAFNGVKRLEIDTNIFIDLAAIFERNPELEEIVIKDADKAMIDKLFSLEHPKLKRVTISGKYPKIDFDFNVFGSSLLAQLEYLDISDLNFDYNNQQSPGMIENLVRLFYTKKQQATLLVKKTPLSVAYYSVRRIIERGKVRVIGF